MVENSHSRLVCMVWQRSISSQRTTDRSGLEMDSLSFPARTFVEPTIPRVAQRVVSEQRFGLRAFFAALPFTQCRGICDPLTAKIGALNEPVKTPEPQKCISLRNPWDLRTLQRGMRKIRAHVLATREEPRQHEVIHADVPTSVELPLGQVPPRQVRRARIHLTLP